MVLTVVELVFSHHERGYRNHSLTEEQKENNRHKSKIRAKVEHVFEAWVNEMGGKLLRSIGIERARARLLTFSDKEW